ncbi:MAG TPA: hypothetical protein H9717_11520 [Candidatus Eisenbergiella merdipullorum]|uniref:Membrane protein 6-pyruvoyl-tetrahydropterin synthase-related domain-containing protein n=1 Tax=Candidatus Eisenbergiella merdipullorum TaxID=2838553 RepID=A0A9D2L1U5_9FIRM|nr:hypothetical protein [Candidatus Eisenbergiella merdipullorum]
MLQDNFRKICKGKSKGDILFALLLAAGAVWLLYAFWLFGRPNTEYVFSGMDLQSEYGIYMENFLDGYGAGYYLDNGIDAPGTDNEDYSLLTIYSPKMNLHRGSYEVEISYATNGSSNTCEIEADYRTYPILTNMDGKGLDTGSGVRSFRWSSPISVEGYQIILSYNGNGYLFVDSISVRETNIWKNITLFCAVLFLLALFAAGFCRKKKPGLFSGQNCLDAFIMLLLVIFATMPLLSPYLPKGHDLNFHLYRIEAIKEALLAGQVPVRMPFSWNNGYGYAVSIFYGELLLYVPALLRMIGISVQNSYKIFVLGINLITCLASYYCFRKMLKDSRAALFGCAVYMLAPYRLSCLFLRASVGEYTAMAFLPLVFYGLYRILGEEMDRKKEKMVWLPAVVGYSGIIQSHVISCVMAGIFTVLVCLVMIRKVLQPRRLLELVKVGVVTALLNCWYLVPFLDYMRLGYSTQDPETLGRFRANGTFLSQLLTIFPAGTGSSLSVADGLGISPEMSFALGGGILAAVVIYLYYRIKHTEKGNEIRKTGDFCLTFGLFTLFMTTIWFPWDFIQQLNGLTTMITQNIQFPWRFLGIASLFLAGTAACLYALLKKETMKAELYGASLLVISFSVISAGYFMSDYVQKADQGFYADETSVSSFDTMQGEFLPAGTNRDIFVDDSLVPGADLEIFDHAKKDGVITVSCKNNSGQVNCVDVSFLYYRGYQAVDQNTGEKLGVICSGENKVRVMIPAGYEGTFRVRFVSPWYWRCSEVISILTLVWIAAVFCLRKREGSEKRYFWPGRKRNER